MLQNFSIGAVNWLDYSRRKAPYGKYNQFDCLITNYSTDIMIHRQFKGIVELIISDVSLPEVPIKIRNRAKMLINSIQNKLANVKTEEPDPEKLRKVYIPNFYRPVYEKAIQKCLEYLEQSKFSLTTCNFYGLPWSLEMNKLFEYWIEHWAFVFAKRIGARFYSDIRENSKIRFYNLYNWKSLNMLKPDIIIEKDSKTLILEVKYKKHLMYFQYGEYSEEVLEDHRHDLHQLLSYMSSSINQKRIGCLIYPKINDEVYDQFCYYHKLY
ncbi:MAG: hypothetical protein Q9N34_04180 [Aquificota bacterium]|nr:hypothetical protein [Aquificota bacterium]